MQTTPVSGGMGPTRKDELAQNKAHTIQVGNQLLEKIELTSELVGKFNLAKHAVKLEHANHVTQTALSYLKIT